MKIGILTYYNSSNFGANLQGISTYMYLQQQGHTPIMINYKSDENYRVWQGLHKDEQFNVHLKFVNSYILNQTAFCHTPSQVASIVKSEGIDAIIIGSDAVLQHHPWQSRLKIGGRRLLRLEHVVPERMFPNPFWGIELNSLVPTALMSVSSQNSDYKFFPRELIKQMRDSLSRFKYISVRDNWTQDMVNSIIGVECPITPDPVFAFNQNAGNLLLSREEIIAKYHLPEKYVLICLGEQCVSINVLNNLKSQFSKMGISCVAFPLPKGIGYKHSFDYVVNIPLVPNDWYALIKYSNGYIGCNMHPIVVSLANAVPCFSIDNWGRKDVFNRKINDGSSKVLHILKEFGVEANHRTISKGTCNVTADEIFNGIYNYPIGRVKEHCDVMVYRYNNMMSTILKKLD